MRKKFKFLVFLMGMVLLSSCTKEQFVKHQDSSTLPAQAPQKLIKVNNVNVEIAQEVARAFYANVNKQKIKYIKVASVDSILDWENRTAIYIINLNPQGYVLTSADIKNEAIIAYSEEGEFKSDIKSIPDALIANLADIIIKNRIEAEKYESSHSSLSIDLTPNDWYDQYALAQVKKYDFDEPIPGHVDPCAKNERTQIDVQYSGSNGYFCKTNWGQKEPYNYYAPKYEYPIGCVAVAMGQIMKFHRHPWFFNWDIMPDVCVNSYNNITEGEKEVARLLRDIGWMVKMKYSESGSGATDYMAWWALYYKYHYWADVPKKWDYNKIVNQLKNDKTPVYASGYAEKYQKGWWIFKWYTYGDGHAYIIDGVQDMTRTYQYECQGKIITFQRTYELLHYNFGWGNRHFPNNKGYNLWFSRVISDIPNTIYDEDIVTDTIFPNYQYYKTCIYNINPK